jgi:hypothetical protein
VLVLAIRVALVWANARPLSYEDLSTSTFTIGFANSIAASALPKLGILTASVIDALLGTAILRFATRNRARQSGPGT